MKNITGGKNLDKYMVGGVDISGHVKGEIQPEKMDDFSQAGRIPTLLLVDTSASMREYSTLLKNAVMEMINNIASHPVAGKRVDLEVVTFDTVSQINIKIPAMEIKNIVSKDNQKIKPEYADKLQFDCEGGTPTGYALAVAIQDIRERYEMLKAKEKAPKSPILFVLSDGNPCVEPSMTKEHDKVLNEIKEQIKQMVKANKIVVVAVEIGEICDPPMNPAQKREREEMHQLMQDITGLPNKNHVRQAKNMAELQDFFQFTSSLLVSSATGSQDTTQLNQQDLSRNAQPVLH